MAALKQAKFKAAKGKCDGGLIFRDSWGVYGEFRSKSFKASQAPSRQSDVYESAPYKAFGREFNKAVAGVNSTYFAKIQDKYGLVHNTAGCREYLQDHIWLFHKTFRGDIDLTSCRTGKSGDKFKEKSAYMNKSYVGKRQHKVLNGGVFCKVGGSPSDQSVRDVVKLIDLFFGVPFSLLDRSKDTIDRKNIARKGIAGRFIFDKDKKFKSNYFIYLLPGNNVIKYPWVASMSIGFMRAMRGILDKNVKPLLEYVGSEIDFGDVRKAINSGSIAGLRKIYAQIKPCFDSAFDSYKNSYLLHTKPGTIGDYPLSDYGIKKSIAAELNGGMYRSDILFEFIVFKGGLPAMGTELDKIWKLDDGLRDHGNTAVGWNLASALYVSDNWNEYKKFYKGYKKDKVNF